MCTDNKMWHVYIHTAPNGKKYVGITCRQPEHRWNHGRGYFCNKHFSAAIQKYGWDNFCHEIVANGLSKEAACDLEKKLIAEYDTTNRDKGYNKSTGGELSGLGVVMSEEARRRTSERRRGKHIWSDDQRKQISERQKGEKHYLYGRHHSDETRQKMSSSHKGRIVTEETRNKLSKALTGIKRTEEQKENISKMLFEKWKNDEYRQMMVEAHSGANSHKAKKILCVETGEVFECIKYACEKYHLHSSAISNVCRGKLKTTGGYHWRYYDGGVENAYSSFNNSKRR